MAASFNHRACTRALLEKYSASINATDKLDCTALHRAAYKGHLEVVKLLTSYSQCDVYAKDYEGDTAADVARDMGQKDVADYLTSKSSVATVTSSLAASNITDDRKFYGKYMYITTSIYAFSLGFEIISTSRF